MLADTVLARKVKLSDHQINNLKTWGLPKKTYPIFKTYPPTQKKRMKEAKFK